MRCASWAEPDGGTPSTILYDHVCDAKDPRAAFNAKFRSDGLEPAGGDGGATVRVEVVDPSKG